MVSELKKRIESGKVFLGMRETLKNKSKIEKVVVPLDCRREVMNLLKEKKVNVESLDLSKNELANKLEIDFSCEVFGLRK